MTKDMNEGLPESNCYPPDWRIWQCKCGWMVDGPCYEQARMDFDCPRCGRKYSTFMCKLMPNLAKAQESYNQRCRDNGQFPGG